MPSKKTGAFMRAAVVPGTICDGLVRTGDSMCVPSVASHSNPPMH